jgi:hypothetical protein
MISPAASRFAAEWLSAAFPSIETRLRIAEATTDEELMAAIRASDSYSEGTNDD